MAGETQVLHYWIAETYDAVDAFGRCPKLPTPEQPSIEWTHQKQIAERPTHLKGFSQSFGDNNERVCAFCPLLVLVALASFYILSAIIAYWDRLRARRRPPQNNDAKMLHLPPELIGLIADKLPPGDAYIYSRASRCIRGCIGNGQISRDGSASADDLQALQPYMPKDLLCHHCVEYHRKSKWRRGQYTNCSVKNDSVQLALGYLPFTHAQQIMNYHTYGAAHQVMPNVAFKKRTSRWGIIHVTEETELRVSDGDVLLRQFIAIRFERELQPVDVTATPRLDKRILLCPHLHYLDTLGPWRGTPMSAFICPLCNAEFSFFLRLSNNGWVNLYLDIYRILGPCRTPSERQWGLVTTGYPYLPTYFPVPPKEFADDSEGIVESRFESADRGPPEPSFFRRLLLIYG